MNNVESIKASEILENYTQAKENICKETRNSIARLKQGLEAKAQQFLYQNQEIVDALRNDQLPQGSNANRQKYLDVLLVAQAILKNATDQYGLAYDSKNSHVDPKRRILNLDGTLTRKLFPIFNQFKITKNTTLMELKESVLISDENNREIGLKEDKILIDLVHSPVVVKGKIGSKPEQLFVRVRSLNSEYKGTDGYYIAMDNIETNVDIDQYKTSITNSCTIKTKSVEEQESEFSALLKHLAKISDQPQKTSAQEKEAREAKEKAAREQAKREKEAQRKEAAREAKEKAAREAKEKAAREAKEKAARKAKEKAAKEKAVIEKAKPNDISQFLEEIKTKAESAGEKASQKITLPIDPNDPKYHTQVSKRQKAYDKAVEKVYHVEVQKLLKDTNNTNHQKHKTFYKSFTKAKQAQLAFNKWRDDNQTFSDKITIQYLSYDYSFLLIENNERTNTQGIMLGGENHDLLEEMLYLHNKEKYNQIYEQFNQYLQQTKLYSTELFTLHFTEKLPKKTTNQTYQKLSKEIETNRTELGNNYQRLKDLLEEDKPEETTKPKRDTKKQEPKQKAQAQAKTKTTNSIEVTKEEIKNFDIYKIQFSNEKEVQKAQAIMNLLTDEQVLKKIKNRFFGYTQDAHCDYMLDFMTDILQQNKHQKSCEAILDRIFYYHIDEGEKLSSQNNQETLQFISDNYNRYKPYMTNKTASTFIARAKYTFNRVNPILLDCISSFEIEWRSQNQLRTKLKNAKLNQTDCQKILKSITHYITKKHNTDYINQSYSTIRTRLIEKIYELNNTQETATSLLNPTWNEIQYNYLQSLKLNIKTRIKSRDILKERLGSYRFNYDIPSTKVTINSKGKPVVITNENKIKLYTDNMELNNCKDIDYKPQLFTYLKTNYPEKYKEFKQTNQEDNVKNFIEFANLKESILPSQTFNPI